MSWLEQAGDDWDEAWEGIAELFGGAHAAGAASPRPPCVLRVTLAVLRADRFRPP